MINANARKLGIQVLKEIGDVSDNSDTYELVGIGAAWGIRRALNQPKKDCPFCGTTLPDFVKDKGGSTMRSKCLNCQLITVRTTSHV